MHDHTTGGWYTREDGKTCGPFAAGLISRFILLERLSLDDEVSHDKQVWRKIRDVDELVPDVLKGDQDDPFVRERLMAARRWADERYRADRRNEQESVPDGISRRAGDRRDLEVETILKHRSAMRHRISLYRGDNTLTGWLILTAALIGITYIGYYAYQHQAEEVIVDCTMPPTPAANWSNCALQGKVVIDADMRGAILRNANLTGAQFQNVKLDNADLAYSNLSLARIEASSLGQALLIGANLRGAKILNTNMQNADLSFANLTGAVIEGGDWRGVNLHKAIWLDGAICAEGSVGECRRP